MNHQKSKEYFERAERLFPGGVNSPVRAFKSVGATPFFVERGEGAYLFDEDGNRYIDYINSWGPLVLGHAHPIVTEAIKKQIEKGSSYGACSKLEGDLAEEIKKFFPSIEKIRFTSSGTEAGMSAVRLVRAATKRPKILKFTGCYHGHIDALLVSAGSGVATFGLPDSPGVLENVTQETISIPFNDLAAVEEVMSKMGDKVAGIFLEPVVGNAGFIKPKDGFLAGLRKVADKHGALLVFDEVMTGFRVSLNGAQGIYGIKPDLTLLGKVIGGGMPVGAFGGRKDLMDMIAPAGPVYQAGTLSGNPVAMVAGLTTIREWSKPKVFDGVAAQTKRLMDGIRDAAKKAGVDLCSDSLGTMFGFFFQKGPVNSFEEAKKSDTKRFSEFFNAALNNGVYFAPSQFEAGFVSTAHGKDVIDETLSVVEQTIR